MIGVLRALRLVSTLSITAAGAAAEPSEAEGLEQGFTLSQRPGGEGPLELDLALRGASTPA